MLDTVSPWLGDIHQLVSKQAAGVICTFTAVLCGAIIGFERQRAQKPAGLRTLILICLGAAIFTQTSLLLSDGHSDRTRIAAQIVSGIGFLGAGAIIRERGLTIGVTTGASIWATAAVGLTVGGGYVAAGIFFSLLILGTLSAARFIDQVVTGKCMYEKLRLEFDPSQGRTRYQIQAVLDAYMHLEEPRFDEPAEGPHTAHIRVCRSHRDHRAFLPDLLSIPQITSVRHD